MHSRGSSSLVSEPGSGVPPEMLILPPVSNLFSSALIIKGNLEIICFATFTLPEIPLALKLNCSLPSSAHQISLFSAPCSSISIFKQTLSPPGLTSVDFWVHWSLS